MKLRYCACCFCFLIMFSALVPAWAFSPNEIAVVYNEKASIVNASHGVALYYAQARNIPQQNIIGISTNKDESLPDWEYVQYIATPLWNDYLSQPAFSHIKVIVLCYGIPSAIWGTSAGSVDAAIMLLGNPNVLNVTHWGLNLPNPFYNSTVSWDEFRDSPANTISRGSGQQPWKLNYLVTRLDAYSVPTTTVTINSQSYSIPSDVKAMIDRAVSANNARRAGLTNAIAVLDDQPNGSVVRVHPAATETSLNSLLAPITGNTINVWREPGTTSANNTFAIGKSNVIAYSSNGSYDGSADLVTTWWRPHNTWKDGAVALYWNVSGDAGYLRVPMFSNYWGSGSVTDPNSPVYNPSDIEPGVLKARMPSHQSSLYDGTWLRLYDAQSATLMAQTQFQSGVARVDLSTVTWTSQDQATYVELHFTSNDPYHPGETAAHYNLGADLYNARVNGFTYVFGGSQSLASELIRDGASATTGNVHEPGGGNTPDPNIILPKYASGYTWAESAWMGMLNVSWQQIAIGDPLMAPYAGNPTVSFADPSPAENRHVAGMVSLHATATPYGSGTIQNVEFWVVNGQSRTKIATDTQAPYEGNWNTLEMSGGNRVYPDGNYSIEAFADQGGNVVGRASVVRSVVVDNANVPTVSISQPETDDSVITDSEPVQALPDGTPTKVEFWLFGEGEPILAGQDVSAPYQCTISSSIAQDEVYDLQAVAYYDGIASTSYSSKRRIVLVNDSTPVTSVSGLGSLTNGTQVCLVNVPVTAGVSSAMNGAFYVEDSSRATGIRVETTETTIAQGTRVTVRGTLYKTGTGLIERRITASRVWNFGSTTCPQPLGMSNLHIGGQAPVDTVGITGGVGLYNTGLLVRVWGKINYVGSDYYYINDGNNLQDGNTLEGSIIVPLDGSSIPTTYPPVKGLRVYCGTLNKPGIGDYVSITGISSTTTIGENIVRCLRLREITDFQSYTKCIKQQGGLHFLRENLTTIPIGSRVRLVNGLVQTNYGTYLKMIHTGISGVFSYVQATTQLPPRTILFKMMTVTGTTVQGSYGDEIVADCIYQGGSYYGAMSFNPGETENAMSLATLTVEESPEYTDCGGGPFRPWPYPTAEEILASESFKTRYNQPGAIGWALSQPDGAKVDLRVENICGAWYNGQVLGLREWFEPVIYGSNLFLYLDKPIRLNARARNMTTIDIIGGKLMTLGDGRRAIVMPEAVYAYTDALGRWVPPLPWPKGRVDTKAGARGVVGEWPWKLKVAP